MPIVRSLFRRNRSLIEEGLHQSVEGLNEAIFKAIEEINAEKVQASASKIGRLFRKYEISKKAITGENLNSTHLKNLVRQGFLEVETKKVNGQLFSVYSLKDKNSTKAQDIPKDEQKIEQKQKVTKPPVKTENKGLLVKCPECDYYCQYHWNECKICGARLTKQIKELNKVKDPLSDFEDSSTIVPIEDSATSTAQDVEETVEYDFIPKTEDDVSHKFTLENLSKSVKYKNNYRLLLVLFVQTVLASLFVAELLLVYGFADVVEFDWFDYFIPAIFFVPLILYYQIRYIKLRDNKIQYRKKNLEEIPSGKAKEYEKIFTKHNRELVRLVRKIKSIKNRKLYYGCVFVVLIVSGIVSAFFSYITFLAFLTIALCFLYPLVQKAHTKHLIKIFELGETILIQYFKRSFNTLLYKYIEFIEG